MNKITIMGTLLALGHASGAHAILINNTDVGSVDTFLCSSDSPDSGQTYETNLVSGCAGESVTLASNIDISNAGLLSEGIYSAIDVSPNAPGFFLLKFGTGNTGNDMLVFENLENLNYLVWTDAQLIQAGIPERHLNSISHYTFANTPTTSVPEPGTLALLGLGLLGLGAVRRRRGDQ